MKKKIIAIALALVCAVSLITGTVSAASSPEGSRAVAREELAARVESIEPGDGDADADGSITVTDSLLIMRYAMGIIGDDALHLDRCDVNADGVVNTTDALTVLRMAMGIV